MNQSETDERTESESAVVIVPWTLPRDRPTESRLEETSGLVEALGCELTLIRAENLRNPNAGTLLSGGLLDRLHEDLVQSSSTMVVIDSALSPIQQRNLEQRLGVKVIDRTGLILEIFGLRALTNEGRLQVELARQLYERSRLVRTWTHLERQRGGGGFLGGPGETQLESDKRMIDRKVGRLRRDLKDVQRTRDVQRAGRQKSEKPVIALIGYTNAGKSTLFNRLSGADVLAKDMPFATLDPTIRRIDLPRLGEGALVDTVGFITDLPTHLIDSFKATLEETLAADILIHVRDRASPVDEDQKRDVLSVMQRLSEASKTPIPPIIEAWNKIDLLDDETRSRLVAAANLDREEGAVAVSAHTGEGIEDLIQEIEDALTADEMRFAILLQPSDGALRSWLYQNAAIEADRPLEDGQIELEVRVTEKDYGRLLSAFPHIKQ